MVMLDGVVLSITICYTGGTFRITHGEIYFYFLFWVSSLIYRTHQEITTVKVLEQVKLWSKLNI